ncbi:nucleotidyltransferase domain-containing protein [Desulfobacterales bacterium HSG17]|nr:nucleotidyltransferase domain-containing protein [Desulfobacterales bacterium HSG17]
MNKKKLLSEIKSEINRDYPLAKVIFFGSRARGSGEIFSDWDILILIEEGLSEKQKIAIHNRLYEMELKTGEIINAIIHTKEEWNNPLMQITPFYENVTREGISL